MRTWRLVVETATGSRELLFIGQMTAGRAAECDISLDDSKVSRRHAAFDATGTTPRVSDLGSRNGILVNNQRVSEADLNDGDVVVIGDARVRLELVPEPAQRDTVPGLATVGVSADPASGPELASPDDDRTAILARDDIPGAARRPAPIAAAPAGLAGDADATAVLMPPRHRPRQVPPTPVAVPAAAPVPDLMSPNPVSTARYLADAPLSMPPPGQSTSPAPGGAPAAASTVQGDARTPRFSWAATVLFLVLGLALLTVALTAIPLMSASSEALDDLGRRQARTLAAWLASSAAPGDPPSRLDATLQSVLGQPGVQDALVMDVATRRVVAPSRMAAETRTRVGAAGDAWASITESRVMVDVGSTDAYVPATVGTGRYVAWVRYEVPTSRDRAVVTLIAVIGAALMAAAVAMLIRRRTGSVLATFTRQVEIAVSGGDPRAMQGSLLPGLDKLPPVVTYLLEQRKAGFSARGSAGGALGAADAEQPTPAWLEMTSTLSVVGTSPHAPLLDVRAWGATAVGRHLLDVFEPGAACNAVVMGLSSLAPAAGSEVLVPVDGHAQPMVLRREASGNLRLAIPLQKASQS